MIRRLLAAVAMLGASLPMSSAGALPPGSVGAVGGIAWMDTAQATGRNARWSGGLRADVLLAEFGLVRLRGELATLHLAAAGATETIEVNTGYHAAMLMGSVGLRAGSLEPFVAAGPAAWLVTTQIQVDSTDESFSHAALGLAALVGLRGADGPLVPRIEAGAASRAGRTALLANVGLSWSWGGR